MSEKPTIDELRAEWDKAVLEISAARSWQSAAAMRDTAYGKAKRLIAALEANAAAQQQRIDALTAALEPFAQRFERDNMDIAGDDSDPMYRFVMNTGELLPGTPVIERKEFRRAHEALRGKGA